MLSVRLAVNIAVHITQSKGIWFIGGQKQSVDTSGRSRALIWLKYTVR